MFGCLILGGTPVLVDTPGIQLSFRSPFHRLDVTVTGKALVGIIFFPEIDSSQKSRTACKRQACISPDQAQDLSQGDIDPAEGFIKILDGFL